MKKELLILMLPALFVLQSCVSTGQQESKTEIVQDEWKLKADDGARLYVTEFGVGDTVVVIHGGFGAEHAYLMNAFIPLAGEHHFVLYDQRGSLRSSCHDSLITVEKHIDDIEALRQNLGLEQLVIASHSMGGFLAMSYAAKYPGKVKKLILISSPPAKCNIDSLTTLINEPTLARWNRPEVIAELEKYGVEKAEQGIYTDRQSSTRNRITFGAINLNNVSKWREIKGGPLFYSGSAGAASSASMQSSSWDFIAPLKQQQIPVHIIHGDDDYLPYQYHDNWKDSLDNTKFYLVNNAGHCLWIDNFNEYKQAMNSALNR